MPRKPITQSVMFAVRLRYLRETAGLSQRQLAAQVGLHWHTVHKLEQGDRSPAWLTVRKLARRLGVTPYQLIGD